MLRTTTIALIVLLVSTASMAALPTPPMDFVGAFQAQNAIGTIANSVLMEHGDVGQNTVSVDIGNKQEVDNVHHLIAKQCQDVFLFQNGKGTANSGTVGVEQALGAVGAQYQAIGSGIAPKAQGQGLILEGAQAVAKSGGIGTGNALQYGNANSAQDGANAAGQFRQSSSIDSWQLSGYQGAAGNVGLVSSSVTAVTEQSQYVAN
jgi:hypothetical protein